MPLSPGWRQTLPLPRGLAFRPLPLPPSECGFALQSILTVNPNPMGNPFVTPGQAALNVFLVNQFETQGGVFPYDSREYLAWARLDHRFNANNEVFVSYR